MSESPVTSPVDRPVADGAPENDPQRACAHAREGHRTRRLRLDSAGGFLRAVTFGEIASPLSERFPTLEEVARYVQSGAFCAPDAHEWRFRARRWAELVAVPSVRVLHLIVWVATTPWEGLRAHPDLDTTVPPALTDLVQLGRGRPAVSRWALALVTLGLAPLYGAVAIAQRGSRVLLALPALAVVVALAAHGAGVIA